MFPRPRIVFFIILGNFQINILLASGIKPKKGETCSPRGPSKTENIDDDPCFKDGLYGSFDVRLTKRDGVAVGHTQHVEIEEGKTVVLTTRSLKPLLFEIPAFLSDEECDHIVGLAMKKGLEESEILSSNFKSPSREEINETLTEKRMQIYCKRVKRYDSNNDEEISVHEFVNFVYHFTRMIVRLNDLMLVYNTLIPDGGSAVTYDNCTKLNRTSFVEFIYQMWNMKRFPYYKPRYSQQSWIRLDNKDPVLKQLTQRLAALAQMSIQQIEESEDLQVVKYMRGGHYHAHYDSTEDNIGTNKKCCGKYLNTNNNETCHLCRYITVLLYLNNVTEGGETAFPVADDEEKLKSKNYSTNLSRSCKKASHIIKPVKGNAIFWYNHAIDDQTGKIGEMEKLSLHGGCDVLEGEKWIANLWINAPIADQV